MTDLPCHTSSSQPGLVMAALKVDSSVSCDSVTIGALTDALRRSP